MASDPGQAKFADFLLSKLTSEEYADKTFKSSDGKKYSLHSVVLRFRSGYFEGALKHDLQEKKSGSFELEETAVELDQFFPLFEGKTLHKSATLEELKNMYQLASKYICPGMKTESEDWMKRFSPSPWTLGAFLELSDFVNDDDFFDEERAPSMLKLRDSAVYAMSKSVPHKWSFGSIRELLDLIENTSLSKTPGVKDSILNPIQNAMRDISPTFMNSTTRLVDMLELWRHPRISWLPNFESLALGTMSKIPSESWTSQAFVDALPLMENELLSAVPKLKEFIMDKLEEHLYELLGNESFQEVYGNRQDLNIPLTKRTFSYRKTRHVLCLGCSTINKALEKIPTCKQCREYRGFREILGWV